MQKEKQIEIREKQKKTNFPRLFLESWSFSSEIYYFHHTFFLNLCDLDFNSNKSIETTDTEKNRK